MNISITETIDHIIASVAFFKPELSLMIAFVACIFVSLFTGSFANRSAFVVVIIGFAASAIFLPAQLAMDELGFFDMLHLDDLSVYSRLIIAIGAIITAFFIKQRHRDNNGDIYSVLIAATLGMNILTMTSHWLLAFIGIEMVSIASYIMVGYFSANKQQSEAAMKYALFGSVCAAVMLYGLSLVYGLTGNLDFTATQHLQGLMDAPDAVVTLALLFVFVGIGFKLGFVPLHVWTPDIYQGAPTAITAFLSTLPKVAALVLFTRLYEAWSSTQFYFSELTTWFLIIIAIATMLIGNLAALRQFDAKRMMAYSSIGHTGFLLMAIFAYKGVYDYLLFYIIAYVLMNFATFLFIDHVEQKTGSASIKAYVGLGKTMPLVFTSFTLVAISLIGLPPTMGFVGKLLVFTSVFEIYQAGNDKLVLLMLIVGALTSVISLFYYFRISLYAFLKNNINDESITDSKASTLIAIACLCTLLLVLLGLFPSLLLDILK